ncbi:30S ribosomal protein S17 [Erysipelothrix urinaevulpis]|uniref:30S ribosomal protein S17 n=1 Tax=Erysipelothrix urinaevulpis TaxID=2683717 RepID=UPI00135ADE5E|nr:30S ribosomal protein S17 [Erysipelothrix urinaevulpis]
MERNNRKIYRGTVVSDAMDKTVVVEVTTSKRHPLYGKRVKYTKKFKAHDEQNEFIVGDIVEIVETRPLSKDKFFRVNRLVQKAVVL